MNEESQGKNKKIIAIIGLLVIVVVIGIGVMVSNQKTNTANQPTSSPASNNTNTSPSPTSTAASPSSDYKDGTYSAAGTYESPGGRESIDISITIKDGAIADTTAVSGSTNPTGRKFQGQFISGYRTQILGKFIDDANVSRVSGSSLTSKGFNSALEQIKAKAKN